MSLPEQIRIETPASRQRPWRSNAACAEAAQSWRGYRRLARGLSLLELMLALALTGVIMVVISMAIDLHLRTLAEGRADVEQAQLARAVLRKIARDLQSTVWYEPIDLSGIQNLAISADAADLLEAVDSIEGESGGTDASAAGGAGGDSGAAAGGGDRGSTPDTGGAVGDDMGDDLLAGDDLMGDLGLTEDLGVTENNTDIAGSLEPTSVPGLYGNQYEIQVDISRLPRADEYDVSATDPTLEQVIDIPSDVKTVAYFLQTSDEATSEEVLPGSVASGIAGLARREQDRAIVSWAAQDGGSDSGDHNGVLLAPEVNYLEFRFFDGMDWYTEWDSEQMESLPVAVEITIGIDPAFGEDPATLDTTAAMDAAAADNQGNLYRMVVHLPVARPAELEEVSDTDLMGEMLP